MRPGYNISTQSAAPARTAPTDTGQWFVVGITTGGPQTPQVVTSLSQFQSIFGARSSASATLNDAIETFFREGGSRARVVRTVGPAAVAATVTLKDSGAANCLTVTALGAGTYANGYQVIVQGYNGAAYSATAFQIVIQDASGNVLEQSTLLTSNADAVAYGRISNYVTIASNNANAPVAVTATLAAGADDNANALGTTQITNALALFTADLGPGQVSVPGVTTTAAQTAVFQHCQANNRLAVCDMADTATAATLTSAAASIRSLGNNAARAGSLWAPWFDVPPLPGTTALRPVPPCAFAAAKMAVVDATGNPNLPAAGLNGILSTPVQAHATFIDSDRASLNTAGVNVIKPVFGQFRIYGYVTPVDRNLDSLYWMLNNVRLDMAIVAQAQAILENEVFAQIDGQGIETSHFGLKLAAMLSTFYKQGALYGQVAADAFSVDVGPSVNTPASLAAGTLSAVISTRRSPEAELVNLNIVRVPITQSV